MLSRILSLHSRTHLRLLSLTLSPPLHSPSKIPKSYFFPQNHRQFSTNNRGGGGDDDGRNSTDDFWKMSQETDDLDDIFGTHDEKSPFRKWESEKMAAFGVEKSWASKESENGGGGDGGEAEFRPWRIGAEEERKVEEVFDIDLSASNVRDDDDDDDEDDKSKEEREMIAAAEKLQLEKEEQSLLEVIKGPDRAFGDLVAASGITDAMLDSLIALKNFQDIEGLPPLTQIEDERYEKTLKKSSRYEMELQKQEDAAKARVRKVDEKGRAYGTGKRKCSIARVWIQPGEGKFYINDKDFDVYFPMLDHRAALLRPFSETKTLGLWDVKCTVKGGGTSGQVDAIRLGVSKALQNWEPGLRPPLREAGFLTRDPRVVERKKPGKAKARKSFQWVKR
ncbi:hypothetical protein RND81_10G181600 [Saponaria officinalis]|uniref:Ribosomal protein S9 n=1 Tax=Saponaria officinalis TaxID=3572 RepID=A0AAW1I662_SAPOF